MSFLQRMSIFCLILLLCISIYKDLSKDVNFLRESSLYEENIEDLNNFSIIKVKVEPGDTILSIIENINDRHLDELHIDELIADFININPHANPYALDVGSYYYFPLYSH